MKHILIASIAMGGLVVAGCEDTTTEAPATEAPMTETETPAEAEAPAAAEMVMLTAALAPGEGIDSEGTGTGEFTFDPADNTLDYTITYAGLTGPAGAAHIHGPADPGGNAPPVVPFADAASPITGTATLTDQQVTELMDGKYYVNVHTAAHGGGEIRGQITAQ